MTLLHEALGAPWCVISVMGAHAGEGVDEIFDRKVADCRTAGRTLWVAKSAKARPRQVQELRAWAGDVEGVLDLWRYADAANQDLPVKFKLGLSTVCAVRRDMASHPDRMKSRFRGIVAAGRLVEPYCTWVR
jgi:hypothetical protein